MVYQLGHFINGKLVMDKTRSLDIYNPAEGEVIGQVNVANSDIVHQAVLAAKAAFPVWSATTPLQRAKILFQFRQLLEAHKTELAKLVNQEHGKTMDEALASLQRGMDVVDFTCGIPNYLKGNYNHQVGRETDAYSLHQPLGVCVGITPFNFPAMIPLWMFPMAIACGNTFILKPSEKDPSCAMRMVELAKQAGVPDGVINVVHGDKETVDALLVHEDVKAVSFVGSTPIAEYVYKTAIQHNKRAQAFGGAKNHCIVMPDADLDQVSNAILSAAYNCAGERCMAISAVIAVGDKVADELVKKMTPKIENLKIGKGDLPDIEMGPLVTKVHLDKVKSYVALGKQEGAVLVVDGSEKTANLKGFFMGACLFDHVKPHMRIYQEEIFGPVLVIIRVNDFEQGLALINEHEYGNGTAIFTSDGYTARKFAEQVQVGMVGINVAVPVPVAYHSFGGWKRSIFADTQMYGADAVRFYTKLKTVTTHWFARSESCKK